MLKVLIAVDGSEHASRAIDAVGKMAKSSAELEATLLCVSQGALLDPLFSGGYTVESMKKLQEEQTRQQDGVLASATEQARARSIKLTEPVRAHGAIANEIVRVAKERQVDQVAMGTRGLGAVAGMVMGSVAQRVVHLSPVPVLLAK